MKKRNLLGAVFFGILAFVMYIGGVSAANWDSTNSLPTESGTYDLTNRVSLDTAWIIDGKHITINTNQNCITVAGEDGIILKNGASLTVNGSMNIDDNTSCDLFGGTYASDPEGNNVYEVTNLIKLYNDGNGINELILNNVYITANEINAIVSNGNNKIQVNNSKILKLYPKDPAIILDSTSEVNINNSPGFEQGYAVNFNADLTKGNIKYTNDQRGNATTIGNFGHILASNKDIANEFEITPLDDNEIESVTITDINGNNISYTISQISDTYLFTMPSSAVTITVKYVGDAQGSDQEDNEQSSDITDNKEENATKADSDDEKKTSNPKTSDMIISTLVVTALSLIGLNLLVLIKKRFN